jgi:hypothetical protein
MTIGNDSPQSTPESQDNTEFLKEVIASAIDVLKGNRFNPRDQGELCMRLEQALRLVSK